MGGIQALGAALQNRGSPALAARASAVLSGSIQWSICQQNEDGEGVGMDAQGPLFQEVVCMPLPRQGVLQSLVPSLILGGKKEGVPCRPKILGTHAHTHTHTYTHAHTQKLQGRRFKHASCRSQHPGSVLIRTGVIPERHGIFAKAHLLSRMRHKCCQFFCCYGTALLSLALLHHYMPTHDALDHMPPPITALFWDRLIPDAVRQQKLTKFGLARTPELYGLTGNQGSSDADGPDGYDDDIDELRQPSPAGNGSDLSD
eukprot:1161275-Pelagomonas_calceolata.AAC.4